MMPEVEILRVPHANAKDENGKTVYVDLIHANIGGWFPSPANKCLHVFTSAGVFPILMGQDDFKNLYLQQDNAELTNKPKRARSK